MKPGGIILAGGKSSRMGQGIDKLRATIAGESLLQRAINILGGVCDPVIVVGRAAPAGEDYADTQFIIDKIPSIGPLGGIYTGLLASEKERNLVLAADMPFISAEVARLLIKNQARAEIIVPRINGISQTLCALYGKECLPAIKRMIDKGEYAVKKLLLDNSTFTIEMDNDTQFLDIDTQTDLSTAKRLLEKD